MPAVLYLDRYHLGDPLFLNGFARSVLASLEPLVIVHGPGEAAERALEAQGRFPEWQDGVLTVESNADRDLVERAGRDLNRQIAHTLNDAGVAAVRLDAGSRGLLKATESGIEAKKIAWLTTLVAQGVVPVVLAVLAEEDGAVRAVSGGAVAGAIAVALASGSAPAPVLLMTKKPLGRSESPVLESGRLAFSEVPDDVLPEPEAVLDALGAGAEVRLIGRSALHEGAAAGVGVTHDVHN